MDNFFMNTVIRDTKGLMNYFSTEIQQKDLKFILLEV